MAAHCARKRPSSSSSSFVPGELDGGNGLEGAASPLRTRKSGAMALDFASLALPFFELPDCEGANAGVDRLRTRSEAVKLENLLSSTSPLRAPAASPSLPCDCVASVS